MIRIVLRALIPVMMGTVWTPASAQDPDCTLPAEPGICAAAFLRYFFDTTTGQCEQFVYGGCGGNSNNFLTLEACETACPPKPCEFEPEVGPCDGIFLRYAYLASTNQCEPFVWGGCGGNANKFESVEECEAACTAVPTYPLSWGRIKVLYD